MTVELGGWPGWVLAVGVVAVVYALARAVARRTARGWRITIRHEFADDDDDV